MRPLVPPALVLAVLVALLYGFLDHLIFGRKGSELLRSLLVSVLGFGLGQVAGMMAGLLLPVLGQVHLIEGSLTCWVALFIARRLNL